MSEKQNAEILLSIERNQHRNLDDISFIADISGQTFLDVKVRLEREDALLNAALTLTPEADLALAARRWDINLDLARSMATDIVKRRNDIDLDDLYFAKYSKAKGEIETIDDPEKRQFKADRLAKRHGVKSTVLPEADPIDRGEVEEFRAIYNSTFDIEILIPTLALPLKQLSKQLNIPTTVFLSTLLPVIGSLSPTKTRLLISQSTNHYAPPIVWFGNVGESGAIKSPPMAMIMGPLKKLQFEAHQSYVFQKENYDRDKDDYDNKSKNDRGERPKPPKLKQLYTDDFTFESVGSICTSQPDRGLVVAIDELRGFTDSMDAHRGGKGADRSRWLSLYNGQGFKVDRKSADTLFSEQSSISVTGTIQPSILKKIMGESDEIDGFWSRFIWIPLPLTKMPEPDDSPKTNISDWLYNTYSRLIDYPAITHEFSPEAKKLWREWHRWTEHQKITAASQSMRAVYPKAREQAARIALIVHNLESSSANVCPTSEISEYTLRSAITFVIWSIDNAKLLYSEFNTTENSPESARAARFIHEFSGQIVGWKRVRAWLPLVKNGSGEWRKQNKVQCLAFMKTLQDFGYGTIEDSQISIKDSAVT